MDDPTKLDLAAALEVIEDLLREQLKTSGRIPETIVTVGGTALAARPIRLILGYLDAQACIYSRIATVESRPAGLVLARTS